MPGQVDGVAIAEVSIGALLLWSGIKGETLSQSVRDILSGKVPSTNTQQIGTPQVSVSNGNQAGSGSNSSSSPGGNSGNPGAPPGDTGAHGASAAANQALARMLAISMGHASWTVGTEWADWKSLWNQESGWSSTALNQGSGATGIPQYLPSAHGPVPANWSSPTVQITWGINYISATYGSPSGAWAHEEANNWY